MGAVGAELLAPQPPSGCITADLDGRAIPRFQVCLIASKRMLEFTRQVSLSGRGADYSAPPPQIPACGFPAPGSCRRSAARLSDKSSRFRVQRHLQFLTIYRS
jgi:hypothetical protein